MYTQLLSQALDSDRPPPSRVFWNSVIESTQPLTWSAAWLSASVKTKWALGKRSAGKALSMAFRMAALTVFRFFKILYLNPKLCVPSKALKL